MTAPDSHPSPWQSIVDKRSGTWRSRVGVALVVVLVAIVSAGADGAAGAKPKSSPAHPPGETDCEKCHTPDGWSPARFAHDRTGFVLQKRHAAVPCQGCHVQSYTSLPRSCAGCHQDPHLGEFGVQCSGCHTEDAFIAPTFSIAAHRQTGFPLIGRHGALPCDECHVEQRDRTFLRAPVACASCHQKDARAASQTTIRHNSGPIHADCAACHSPTAFAPARFAAHEKCFPITVGVHAPVGCKECHGVLQGVRADGDCGGVLVACAACHTHRAAVEDKRHKNVAGYAHVSPRCAECHRPLR